MYIFPIVYSVKHAILFVYNIAPPLLSFGRKNFVGKTLRLGDEIYPNNISKPWCLYHTSYHLWNNSEVKFVELP